MKYLSVAATVFALAWFCAPRTSFAQDAGAACARLGGYNGDVGIAKQLGEIPDAVTTVFSARLVPAERDIPEICRIEGVIAPNIGFMLRMPTKNWNGKFLMGGCGGPCGMFLTDRVDPALVRNYAVVVTDMGHKGPLAAVSTIAKHNLRSPK